MTRLKIFILFFFLAISVPISYVVWQTYIGLEHEEQGQMLYFSNTIFDRMELELAALLQTEENRPVEEYNYFLGKDGQKSNLSPLVDQHLSPYILGYLQNNPDNSFQTPHLANLTTIPAEKQQLYAKLLAANSIFNNKKIAENQKIIPLKKALTKASGQPFQTSQAKFSERYLSAKNQEKTKEYLGKRKQRTEKISPEQLYNLFQEKAVNAPPPQEEVAVFKKGKQREIFSLTGSHQDLETDSIQAGAVASSREENRNKIINNTKQLKKTFRSEFEVEIAPFQSVLIDDNLVYIFRRVILSNQIYRQGFLIETRKLLDHLINNHFNNQPLADFAEITLSHLDLDNNPVLVKRGHPSTNLIFSTVHDFPAPFSFLSATITADSLPASSARQSLNINIAILVFSMLAGLTAIYYSVKTILAMAERRSQFVSSVTHELKTPLTNIRMYVEMLQQGIATTPKKEQEYLEILGNESTRLSSLINNVLELAKLEKRKRKFILMEGDFSDVIDEVKNLYSQQLQQQGYTVDIQLDKVWFTYDRDIMTQILLNLIENSIKFGQDSAEKRINITVKNTTRGVEIAVSDTGPGIPSRSIKKIFDDFYRADNELTSKTGGTGIGLALVKKFITALGGKVSAKNNVGPGCTITIQLFKP